MQLHAGYISDGVKNYLYQNNGPLDWKDVLYYLSVFELKTNEDLRVKNKESLFAVADNIVSRGLSTKPSIYIEKQLSETFEWTKRNINSVGEINYKLIQEDEDLLRLLRRSFINIDPRIKNIKLSDLSNSESVYEKDFYNNTLGRTFGTHCLQIAESQRSLPDIIKYCGTEISKPLCEHAEKFNKDNDVDFSIQFPRNNLKKKNGLILEIDDDTHNPQANPTQEAFDKQRDLAVTDGKVNWCKTVRLRKYGNYDEIRSVPNEKINEINEFLKHPFNDQLKNNFESPIYSENGGLDALQIALTPFAVARIQKTIIQMLRANVINIDQEKWRIAILERDVPCGALAIEDLKHLLINLLNLRYGNTKIPEIELRIYSSYEFKSAKLNENIETEIYEDNNVKSFSADILIDISILQRPKFTKPSNEFLEKIGNPKVFIIRSCYAPKSVWKISVASSIGYLPVLDDKKISYSKLRSHKYFVRNIFRKVSFRNGQIEIIDKAIQKKNVIGLLPTGSGKSLCYQLCSLLQPGITIIVDPLVSLMKDQVQNLINLDISHIDKINSEITSPQERSFKIERMSEGFNQFIFVSPERFQIQEFRDALKNAQKDDKILQVVIDEAHCVSEWGHDFRPAYLNLGFNARNLISQDVILFGLTGTASFDVLSDVAREVNINQQDLIEANSFDRKELRFSIQGKRFNKAQADSKQKLNILKKIFLQIPRYFGYSDTSSFYNDKDENGFKNCGIIFCPHGSINFNENSAFSVGTVQDFVNTYFNEELKIDISIEKYSGSLGKNDREIVQDKFKENKSQLLISTSAFGMGIDKPNIRYIIHYSCPQSIEAYYQEAGRAGRDRNRALCISIFSDDKIFFQKLNGSFTIPKILNIYDREFLDEETNGAEAIEITDDVITERNYDHRNRENTGNVFFNYKNFYLSNRNSNDEIKQIPKLPFGVSNDATRRIYFQETNFPGKDIEGKIFGGILSEIDLNQVESIIPFKIEYKGLLLSEDNGYVERGIYRLLLIGIVKDYVKDYNARQFKVETVNLTNDQIIFNMEQYISRYKSQSAVRSVRKEITEYQIPGNNEKILYKAIYFLIDFIYENIERKRRNALREFIRVLRIGSSNNEKFREELDNYFNSKYLPILREYITNYKLEVLWDLIKEVDNNYDLIRHLHGAAVRMLIAFDDNMLFQLIRSYTSFFHPEYDKSGAMDYFNAFETAHLHEDLGKPNRKTIGVWIDKFHDELISRQPDEDENISNAILNYQLNIINNFNSKFLKQKNES